MRGMRLAVYAAAHFLVDLSCAALVLRRLCPGLDPMLVLLLYNFLAFACQMPLGLLADWAGHCRYFAAGGCLLVLLAWLLPTGLPAVAAAGLGNAAFHVGGGLDTLNSSAGAGPLGIFVSPGALGVWLGGRWSAAAGVVPICLVLAGAAAVISLLPSGPENAPLEPPAGGGRLVLAGCCLFAVVVLRSWVGMSADFPWKADVGVLAVLAVAGGKAAGGLLSDRFGAADVAVVSLLLSAACYLLSDHAAFGLAALFLFNMTMPLTLRAMADRMPGTKGLSFGLLTFALFLGFLPAFFRASALQPPALAAAAVFSIPLLCLGQGRDSRHQAVCEVRK